MNFPVITYTRDKEGRVIAAHVLPGKASINLTSHRNRAPMFGAPYGRTTQTPGQRLQSFFA